MCETKNEARAADVITVFAISISTVTPKKRPGTAERKKETRWLVARCRIGDFKEKQAPTEESGGLGAAVEKKDPAR